VASSAWSDSPTSRFAPSSSLSVKPSWSSDLTAMGRSWGRKVDEVHQRAQNNDSIGAETFNDHDRPPRRFSTGRVCAAPDCATRLSIYNESHHCALHRVGVAPRTRRRSFT